MNLKRILLYIEPKTIVEPISKFTMSLAQSSDTRVYVLSVIQHPKPDVKTRVEEQAWKRLYEVEEDAFEAGVKTSLLLEEIDLLTPVKLSDKIINVAQTFLSDALVLSNETKCNIKKIIDEMTIPVIIVPEREKLNVQEV
jgi:nucleotide-binding universal stress UspA family protein